MGPSAYLLFASLSCLPTFRVLLAPPMARDNRGLSYLVVNRQIFFFLHFDRFPLGLEGKSSLLPLPSCSLEFSIAVMPIFKKRIRRRMVGPTRIPPIVKDASGETSEPFMHLRSEEDAYIRSAHAFETLRLCAYLFLSCVLLSSVAFQMLSSFMKSPRTHV